MTRHTINFHEYMETAIWQPGRRYGRKEPKRRDGTGRQDRICGEVDRLRTPSLPLAPVWSERTGGLEGVRWCSRRMFLVSCCGVTPRL